MTPDQKSVCTGERGGCLRFGRRPGGVPRKFAPALKFWVVLCTVSKFWTPSVCWYLQPGLSRAGENFENQRGVGGVAA